jgi:hypothetical protein
MDGLTAAANAVPKTLFPNLVTTLNGSGIDLDQIPCKIAISWRYVGFTPGAVTFIDQKLVIVEGHDFADARASGEQVGVLMSDVAWKGCRS